MVSCYILDRFVEKDSSMEINTCGTITIEAFLPSVKHDFSCKVVQIYNFMHIYKICFDKNVKS
jgi:hypothetical protein